MRMARHVATATATALTAEDSIEQIIDDPTNIVTELLLQHSRLRSEHPRLDQGISSKKE